METEEYTLSIAKERRSSFEIEDGLVVMLNTKGTSVALIVVGLPDGLDCFEKYNIAAASCIRIGKQPGCEICYDFRGYLSKLHVVLQREGTAMRLHDKSTNGVFLNGKRVKGSKLLAFGDSINILGLKLIYLGESLAIWSGGRPIEVDTTVLRPYKQPEIAEGNAACEEETCFKRAPRIVTELHHEPVEIEGPPPPNRPCVHNDDTHVAWLRHGNNMHQRIGRQSKRLYVYGYYYRRFGGLYWRHVGTYKFKAQQKTNKRG